MGYIEAQLKVKPIPIPTFPLKGKEQVQRTLRADSCVCLSTEHPDCAPYACYTCSFSHSKRRGPGARQGIREARLAPAERRLDATRRAHCK
jgi:hypothetical protein